VKQACDARSAGFMLGGNHMVFRFTFTGPKLVLFPGLDGWTVVHCTHFELHGWLCECVYDRDEMQVLMFRRAFAGRSATQTEIQRVQLGSLCISHTDTIQIPESWMRWGIGLNCYAVWDRFEP
jgi:hypothetical protein